MLDFHRDDFQPDNLTTTQRELLEARKARAARIHAAACYVESSKPVPRIVAVKPRVEPKAEPAPKPETVAEPESLARHSFVWPENFSGPVTPFLKCKTIQRVVAGQAMMGVAELMGPSRVAHFIAPRFLAIYLVKEFIPWSLPHIGRRFGGRDRTSIIHAIAAIKRRIASDSTFAAEVESLKAKLRELFGEGG